MDNVRKYVGTFNGVGRFNKSTVTPGPGMEKFLEDFVENDTVIVFNAIDFFGWHDKVFNIIAELQNQNGHQNDKEGCHFRQVMTGVRIACMLLEKKMIESSCLE